MFLMESICFEYQGAGEKTEGCDGMKIVLTKNRFIWPMISIMLLTQSCALFSSGSRADYAIPGCERAWESIAKAKGLSDLKTLVINDCAVLYKEGWRLPIKNNKGGTDNAGVCNPAWNNLESKKQLDNVRFMITHNCPVFYRHGWVIPPN